MPGSNGIGWFEIGAEDPAAADLTRRAPGPYGIVDQFTVT